MDESGTDEAECLKKLTSGRRVACVIGSLVNAMGLQLECARAVMEPRLSISSSLVLPYAQPIKTQLT